MIVILIYFTASSANKPPGSAHGTSSISATSRETKTWIPAGEGKPHDFPPFATSAGTRDDASWVEPPDHKSKN